jgi:ABC-type polysaccharide/polyol phosphate export permease
MVAIRDIRVKYKQSVLGPLWVLLQPLGLLGALLITFAGVADVKTNGVSNLLFTVVGVTVWTFTQQTTAVASTAITANGTLVRRSTCPRVALVLGAMLANLPALGIMTAISLVLTLVIKGLVVQVLLLPVLTFWLMCLMWGPMLLFAGVAVRYRDAIAVVPMILQAGIFLSPIGFPIQTAPEFLQVVLVINPLAGMLEIWRWAVLGTDPIWAAVGVTGIWTVVLATVGWRVFSRLEVSFADFL